MNSLQQLAAVRERLVQAKDGVESLLLKPEEMGEEEKSTLANILLGISGVAEWIRSEAQSKRSELLDMLS
jgi:hypothetical protein